jgi:hypothetical protein
VFGLRDGVFSATTRLPLLFDVAYDALHNGRFDKWNSLASDDYYISRVGGHVLYVGNSGYEIVAPVSIGTGCHISLWRGDDYHMACEMYDQVKIGGLVHLSAHKIRETCVVCSCSAAPLGLTSFRIDCVGRGNRPELFWAYTAYHDQLVVADLCSAKVLKDGVEWNLTLDCDKYNPRYL